MATINEYKPYKPKEAIDGAPDYTIREDTLYRSTPVEVYENGVTICKVEEVITKEAFIKCYEEWILNRHTDDGK